MYLKISIAIMPQNEKQHLDYRMNINYQFSVNADTYGRYNIIQQHVAKYLIEKIANNPSNIIDIGCGRGAVFNAIDWGLNGFLGIDFSKEMLDLHPVTQCVKLRQKDFNQQGWLQDIDGRQYDRVISASALQWATDLERTFIDIKQLNAPVSLAIFTSGTFKTLHQVASVSALLRSAEEVQQFAEKHFSATIETVRYTLKFDTVREMFRYIKKTGVSGARNVLSFQQTKALMNNYPLDHLEFEVVFIHEGRRNRQ